MNRLLLVAVLLIVVIALVHSVLGQRRIFHRLRHDVPPTVLNGFQIGILWASWHLVTVFGLTLAAILFLLAYPDISVVPIDIVCRSIAVGMAAGAALVAIGTKGRHPAWVGLLLVAAIVAWSGFDR